MFPFEKDARIIRNVRANIVPTVRQGCSGTSSETTNSPVWLLCGSHINATIENPTQGLEVVRSSIKLNSLTGWHMLCQTLVCVMTGSLFSTRGQFHVSPRRRDSAASR